MLETIRAVGVLLRQPNLINVQYEIGECCFNDVPAYDGPLITTRIRPM